MNPKQLAAEKAAEAVQDGMIVGLGTGSTATFAIEALGKKVAEGLHIRAVASSVASENLARDLGIPIMHFQDIAAIDLTIDGADEVDPQHNLIKGGGGALLREKILAYNSRSFVVVVDETKLVDHLGRFPLPVEIVPFAAELTLRQLQALGGIVHLRQQEGKLFFTDNGNLIADCNFKKITKPSSLDTAIQMIPGVVDCGLFAQERVTRVVVGYADGRVAILN